MSATARSLAAALVGVVLVAALLAFAPRAVSGWIGDVPGAAGECLFTLAIFGPVLLLGLVGRRIACPPGKIGGDAPARAAMRGAALGFGGLLLATGYTWFAGTLTAGSGAAIGASLLLGCMTMALQVTAEEVLFRGWLQPSLTPVIGVPAAVALVAAIFAALHLLAGASGVVALLNLFLGGLLFGLLAVRDQGIVGACAAHLCWNGGEQFLLGLDPNPGIGAFGSIIDLDLVGAASWGGSEQGLNASWAMSFALAAIIVPLILARCRRSD